MEDGDGHQGAVYVSLVATAVTVGRGLAQLGSEAPGLLFFKSGYTILKC